MDLLQGRIVTVHFLVISKIVISESHFSIIDLVDIII
ncbi:hypothetical protein F383_27013 [Gossypium arboreum]|uniref:Uncharacterized protein n=1 Tax=Gossypium arboreum TaxID=29729 RepID=A0A0B0MMG2_GOSAR|nr:hypothetical protein F383_27013 [Gossypium arboreum]